ncbi:hypothetical protein VTL71DRAFT_1406 [Oculimacula yallundae]|uniref:DUF7730 domain-containing protein n=1 Tax=Oculimacula yallundae TaxID=86028 RepID=A0ABR4CAK7_9HELO
MADPSDLQEREKVNLSTPATSHDTTPTTSITKIQINDAESFTNEPIFPLLSLPLELRLKIYTYILPPRHHKIVTSIPPTNYFYNTSSIPNQTTYPFGRSSPSSLSNSLSTPYKVLTKNTHPSYPHASITPSLLLACRQIHSEAEPLLYNNNASIWDFGVHVDALRAFWGERSKIARASVRSLRIGFEVPVFAPGALDERVAGEMLGRKAIAWEKMLSFVKGEMGGLRELDLLLWCSDGSERGFPEMVDSSISDDEFTSTRSGEILSEREITEALERRARFEKERRWREWEWTEDLLSIPSLRQTRITCWSALPPTIDDEASFGVTVPKFDSWVAGRMIADGMLREKMVKEGVVVSEEVVILGARVA